MFGDNGSCMAFLQNEFDARYPLAVRRFEYFHLQHKEAQLFSDFASTLIKQGKETDLEKIKVEDLHCYHYITACNDAKLREKLLRVNNPTLLELDTIVRTYEKATTTSKAIDEATSVRQMKSTYKRNEAKSHAAKTEDSQK